LFEQLASRPDMFRYEMIEFLYDSFGLEVSPTTISRTLKTEKWTRKTNGRVAKQRNPDLRELYLYKLSDCRSYQLVFIDESGCDKRSGHRRQGWAPSGATPVQVAWKVWAGWVRESVSQEITDRQSRMFCWGITDV
jgi:hypothetical protein